MGIVRKGVDAPQSAAGAIRDDFPRVWGLTSISEVIRLAVEGVASY